MTYAVVDVVTNAIGVEIGSAIAATHANRVELIAIAVAVAEWDACAAADPTFVEGLARTIAIVADVRIFTFLVGCAFRVVVASS